MGRRSNGSGTVYRSRDARRTLPWCASVVVGWSPRGTPIRVSRWYATRRQAEAARGKMADALRETGVLPDDRITVADYLAHWLRDNERANPRTARVYAYAVGKATAVLGHHRLATLRPTTVEAALRELPPGSVKIVRGVLSAAYSDAERDGLVQRNPMRLVRLAPHRPREQRVPTAEDVRTLLSRTTDARTHALLAVMLTTGLRPGEACGLRWPDIGPASITVERQLAEVGAEWVEDEPKTPSSRRTVPLVPVAAASLARWRVEQASIAARVFDPLTPRSLRPTFEAACKAAGVEPFPPHSARRFVATMLARDPKTAAAIMGHSSVAMTLDVYSRTTDEARARAAELMSEVIG